MSKPFTRDTECKHDFDWLNGRCYWQTCKKCGEMREKWMPFELHGRRIVNE